MTISHYLRILSFIFWGWGGGGDALLQHCAEYRLLIRRSLRDLYRKDFSFIKLRNNVTKDPLLRCQNYSLLPHLSLSFLHFRRIFSSLCIAIMVIIKSVIVAVLRILHPLIIIFLLQILISFQLPLWRAVEW